MEKYIKYMLKSSLI